MHLALQSLLLFVCCVSISGTDITAFSRVWRRQCLLDEFKNLHPELTGEIACAQFCARVSDCQGFRLTPSTSSCEIFVFSRCSHSVNSVDCSNFEWIFVRDRDELEVGRLCPAGYSNSHLTSSYKVFNEISWTSGRARCEAEPGLTKFADGEDRAEVEHLHWLKVNVNSGKSMYVGGHRPGSSASDPWMWVDCNVAFKDEVWLPGQPNAGGSKNKANVWSSHLYGLDDELDTGSGIGQILCECVDPFV